MGSPLPVAPELCLGFQPGRRKGTTPSNPNATGTRALGQEATTTDGRRGWPVNRVQSRDSKGPGTVGRRGGDAIALDVPPSALLVLPTLPLTARVSRGRPEPPPLPTGLSTPARLSGSYRLLRRLPQPPSRPPFSSTALARLLGRAGGEEEQSGSLRGSACDTWSAREGWRRGCGEEQKLVWWVAESVGRSSFTWLQFIRGRDSVARFVAPFFDVVVLSWGYSS